jgi:hypothetical protein
MIMPEKKRSYWWIIVLVIIVGWIYIRNLPDKNISFIVEPDTHWLSCWNTVSNLSITYEILSSDPIDIIFTPTKKDAENLNETSLHYETCYMPDVLKTKGECSIHGKGCMVLLNKKTTDATVNLKYSTRILN